MKGKLVTIEGIDGSGKTTIMEYLKQNPVYSDIIFTREPTKDWIGQAVMRAIHSDVDPLAELLLFTADHAEHIRNTIKPAIKTGRVIISDRYSDSRVAYQSSTLKDRLDEPVEWIKQLHRGWTVVPDLTLLLDIDPEIAVSRCNSRDAQTKFEKVDFLSEVRNVFLQLAEENPQRFVIIDASQSLDKVKKEVDKVINGLE
ncbi:MULTISPECIES: dTMP kinase [Methanohalophilus]|jgi:dTMP kinase|uniref:Probable thymidylate kinase n=1 Tax=Methanohalophilus euhalobius TaxID=51203 RepID=A0A285GCN3_9EURY|nr:MULTISPECIES: dTMP kinase [Methanohalophilus]RSD36408.1 MAG: dTMP kinase [Methanohalophilus sp.]ODV50224.1 MAG: dTMP kinase [Methanohalophilus sp. 2-GBenrich]PQV41998.1 thymidylate kinase [Methanohalophilus euhalobius]RNI12136.1 dTMP kinase [Methanohalophilus euhalobius]RXG34419.1 dTMP kinase [Methanohalophilus sp. WG1-DM]